jgi:hypothetical protein
MRTRLVSPVCFALGILFALQLSAQEASPAKSTEPRRATNSATTQIAPAKTVKVSILKSWGDNSIWDAMSTNWQNFGKIPVSVDDTYIDSDFTYQNLVQSKANVIVLSNPAGGVKQYSAAEIAAVAKYAKTGHTVIGTYLVFQWSTVDNRGLAPVFGLSSKIEYNTTQVGISNLFDKTTKKKECLFNGITGSSWQSEGYAYTEVPATGDWTGHLAKATAVAESDKYVGVVTLYTTSKYTGVLVSNFPEYNGGTDDEQLLYNAVTCYKTK